MPPARRLVLYSKHECHLCDEAMEKLEPLAARYGLTIEKVDIEGDPVLFEKHRYRIPVLELDGEELGWGRLSAKAIERRLARLRP